MKKILILFIISMLLFPNIVLANDGNFTPNASAAVLIDNNTKEILYGKSENKRTSVASLTKMMGLILIFEKLEEGSLKTNEIITVSKNAKEMGGTQLWLEEGEKITVNDLLKGITMASANDAMVAMAERVSGTEESFVKKMNEKAKKLGLKNTNFVNCTGFDEKDAYSSAYDMAIIASELLKHKKILDYTSKYESYIRENTNNRTWITNTNKLVNYYKGCDGLKTGYTDNAGSSIAVTAERNGLRLIAISFGYPNTTTRNKEMTNLLDYGFSQYISKKVLDKNKIIKKIELNKADKNTINLYLKDDINVIERVGSKPQEYTYMIKLINVNYPIKKGDKLGTLYLKNGSKIVQEADLITNTDIRKAGFISQYFGVLRDILTGNI